MNKFINDHPYITGMMFLALCNTVVNVTKIIKGKSVCVKSSIIVIGGDDLPEPDIPEEPENEDDTEGLKS